MLTDQNFDELKQKGYTVVPNVLTSSQCDKAIDGYNVWLRQFQGKWPKTNKSLVRGYNCGHIEPTWEVRHSAKSVFEQLWKTEKLLTSFDAVAIGRPPEDGEEPFEDGSTHWLHLDQESSRDGLHAYQGGVYLEESCEDDWTLQVMENSHKVFHKLFEHDPKAARASDEKQFYRLNKTQVRFFQQNGCKIVRVPVPKGGMVLWDSRTVHANAQPMENRAHPGRWRFVVFVSMTPAIWASGKDLSIRKNAYDNCLMTNHWSSDGVMLLKESADSRSYPKILASAAKTPNGQLLSGVTPYDFTDGKPNGPPKPVWKRIASVSAEQSVMKESMRRGARR
ncbi:hypothetical protein ACF0H5_012579 [Mactra antiquata]